MKVEWSPLALDRVSEIARYIAKDNPDAAERWVSQLFDSVERLADFPESGRIVPEVGVRRIRELIFGAYRVIYSVKDKVEILTVRRGSQLLDVSEIDDEQGNRTVAPKGQRPGPGGSPPELTRCGRSVAEEHSVTDSATYAEERAFMRAVVDGLADLEAGREHPQPGITLEGFRQRNGHFERSRLIV